MTLPLAADKRETALQPNAGQGPELHPCCENEQRNRLPRRIGIELLLSVTGEAEAGSAGEQPAEE